MVNKQKIGIEGAVTQRTQPGLDPPLSWTSRISRTYWNRSQPNLATEDVSDTSKGSPECLGIGTVRIRFVVFGRKWKYMTIKHLKDIYRNASQL